MESRKDRERTEMVAVPMSTEEITMLNWLRAKEGMSKAGYLRYLLRAESRRRADEALKDYAESKGKKEVE